MPFVRVDGIRLYVSSQFENDYHQSEGGERLIEVPVCDGCTGVVHEPCLVVVVVLVARTGPGTQPFEICIRGLTASNNND